MDAKDTTDYTSTISPDFLSSKDQDAIQNDDNVCEVTCCIQSCNLFKYIIILIFLYILLEILTKLKHIVFKLTSILSIVSTIAFKVDSIYSKEQGKQREQDTSEIPNLPNLNFILDFIHQIDKNCLLYTSPSPRD